MPPSYRRLPQLLTALSCLTLHNGALDHAHLYLIVSFVYKHLHERLVPASLLPDEKGLDRGHGEMLLSGWCETSATPA